MTHALMLDSFTLDTGDEWFDTGRGYSVRTFATDADFGNAEPITSTLPSALAVGSRERITGWGNRSLHFQVQFRSDTAAGLALAEEDLSLACQKARELTWLPPIEDAPLTVHDVHHAYLDAIFDDLDELEKIRAAHLRIAAMPFPRSAAEVVIPAIGSGTGTSSPAPVVTSIYSGASTTGWTAINGTTGATMAAAAASGGGVRNAAPFVGSLPSLRYSTSIAMGTNRWLVIRREVDKGTPVDQIQIVGTMAGFSITRNIAPAATIGLDAFYLMPGASVTINDLRILGRAGQTMTVRSMSQQDRMPFVSNTRQLIRSFNVPGSAETEGSLAISHATTPLGQVMVYSWPEDGSGYVPPISAYITSSTADAVTDNTAVLGRYLPISNSTGTHRVYEVPAAQVPEGTYTVLVRAKTGAAAGAMITLKASTLLGGQALAEASEQRFLSWTTAYRVQSIGQVTLPPAAVPRGSAAKVRVTIGHSQPSVELRLDEVYLCNADTGDLTLLDCGTGTVGAGQSSTRVWLDAPTVDRPYQAIWVGTLADRSDARHVAGLDSSPAVSHRWANGAMNFLTVSNAYDAAAEGRCFPRWTQNAGVVAA